MQAARVAKDLWAAEEAEAAEAAAMALAAPPGVSMSSAGGMRQRRVPVVSAAFTVPGGDFAPAWLGSVRSPGGGEGSPGSGGGSVHLRVRSSRVSSNGRESQVRSMDDFCTRNTSDFSA